MCVYIYTYIHTHIHIRVLLRYKCVCLKAPITDKYGVRGESIFDKATLKRL